MTRLVIHSSWARESSGLKLRCIAQGLLLLMGLVALTGCPCKNVSRATQERSNRKLRHGIRALLRGQLEDAHSACTLAKKFNSCSAEARNCLGLIAFRRGKLALAEKHFKDALFLSPDFAEARNNLGNVAFKRREYKRAAQWFKSVIDRVPCHKTALYNRSLVLMKLRQWKQARTNTISYRVCLRDERKNTAQANYLLGLLEFNRKDYDDSLRSLQLALKSAPLFADALLLACKAAYQKTKYALACTYCSRALRQRPKHTETRQAHQSLQRKLAQLNKSCQ